MRVAVTRLGVGVGCESSVLPLQASGHKPKIPEGAGQGKGERSRRQRRVKTGGGCSDSLPWPAGCGGEQGSLDMPL